MAADRWQIDVGVQSRYYDASPTAALFYQAEDMTPLGTSDKSSRAGASGSGSNAIRNVSLGPIWQAIMKSEIDSTNAALTHKGTFRVKARIENAQAASVPETVRLEWGGGDYLRPTLNDPVTLSGGAFGWRWVNLGLVQISPDSDRWEFRILGRSSTTTTANIFIDCIAFFPTTEGYIEMSAVQPFEYPTLFSVRDDFVLIGTHNLGLHDAPVGGAWGTTGATGDFVVTGGSDGQAVAQRTTVSDSVDPYTGGRFGFVDSPTLAAAIVQADFELVGTLGSATMGLLVRYVNTSNYLLVVWSTPGPQSTQEQLSVRKRVAGTTTQIGVRTSPGVGNIHAGAWTLRAVVDTAGRVWVWTFPVGSGPGEPKITTYDAVLATGGALDDGLVGIYDHYSPSTGAGVRKVDNFFASVPTIDAACYASQSLELTHDRARRETPGGTFWSRVSGRRGRYLRIPPSGLEGRSTRIVVLPHENDPETMADPSAPANIEAQLFVTPRGLVVPGA